MIKNVGRVLVVAVTAALALAGTATAASAAQNASVSCMPTPEGDGYMHPCGSAYFTAETGNGDEYLKVCDGSRDGHSAVVQNYRYDLANTGPYYGWVTGGLGDCKTWVLHIPEGKAIDFRVCPGESGTGAILWSYCGNWVRGVA